MKKLTLIYSSLLVLSITVLPTPGISRDLTLSEAVRLGLDTSPDLRMEQADVDKASAEEAGSIGQIGPRVTLESQLFYWDAATDLEIEMPQELVDLVKPLLPAGQILEFPPMKVQERLTGEVVVMAVQPLSPLYSLANAYLARKAAHNATIHDLEAARNTVRHNVTEAFFRLRSIRSLVEVAQMGVKQVHEHLRTARAFHKAGFVGRDDVLRAETALARVEVMLIEAESGEKLARAALNVAVGLPVIEPTNPVGVYPENPPPYDTSLEECIRRALDARPEISAVGRQLEAATAGHRARIGSLLPTLSAVFRYGHQEGNLFMHEDSYFVGGALTWNFWQWGDQWFQMKAAEATRDKALAGLDKARDRITLDVTRAWTDLTTARSSIGMHRKAAESATENLRVVTSKYEAKSATSVEILDAQSDLNQARAAFQRSLFAYYTAKSNLERALGTGEGR